MTKVSTINSQSGQRIVDGAIEKLRAYAEELGLSVEQEGRWVYDRAGQFLNLKLQFVVGGAEGKQDLKREDFGRKARLFGMNADHYGQTVTFGNAAYTIAEISLKSHKYPLLLERIGGGRGLKLDRRYIDRIVAGERKFDR